MKNLFFLLLLLLALPVRAESADAQLDAANRAYQEGHYEESARLFGQLIETDGYSASLCLDRGNAELKAGRLGAALLDYERARYLAPGDAGINRNLQLARRQAHLEPNPYRWWQVVLRGIDWTVWLAVVLGCLALMLLAIVGRAFLPAGGRRVCRGLLFVSIPLFLFCGFVELIAIGFSDRVEGVVTVKEATLRLSPFESAERTGSVPEGELVTVEKRHDHYLWIDDRSRQSGWVDEKEVAPVVPGSF